VVRYRKSTLGLRTARRSHAGKRLASRSGGETNFLHFGQTTVGCPRLSLVAMDRFGRSGQATCGSPISSACSGSPRCFRLALYLAVAVARAARFLASLVIPEPRPERCWSQSAPEQRAA
jgi:hypothetical protein